MEAFDQAREMNIKCLALLGNDGGSLLSLADVAILVPSWNTQRIQETQILVLHVLCELVEKRISSNPVRTAFAIQQDSVRGSNGKLIPYSGLFSLQDPRSGI